MLSSLIRKMVPERFRPIGYLTHLARSRTDCRVHSGPFKGMRYIDRSAGSAYIPKLLGIYERELAPQIETICSSQPSLIVDIGAAEGYYAVGLALRNPHAQVIAFEMEPKGREMLDEMARLNEVANRVKVFGKCEPQDLQKTLEGSSHPLVVCDTEGYEEWLLDPSAIPALHDATILVEMHDFIRAGLTEKLQARFQATHHIERIWQEFRHRSEFPYDTLGTRLLPKAYLDWAVSEWRPVRMSWLWMEPKKTRAH